LLREMLDPVGLPGFELDWVDNLSEGEKRLASGNSDLLLLNLSLLNGHSLEQVVGCHPQNTGLPVIVLTNRDDEALAAKAMRSGAQDYLVKEQISSNLLRRAIMYALERAQVEEALRESGDYLRTLLDSVDTAVVMIDAATHQVVDINAAAIKLIGAGREQIIGKSCHQFLCPAEAGKCPVSDLGQTGDRSERILLAAGGRSIPVLKTVTPITSKGREYLLESFVDISERKQVEEALRESEQLYRSLMDNIDLGVNLVAPNYTILLTNAAQARTFGRPPEEFIGEKCYQIFRWRKAPCEDCPGQRALASGRREENEIERRLGDKKFQARVIAFPIFDGGERPIGFVEVIEDITERKGAEWQLQAAHARLQEMEAIVSRTPVFVFQSRAEAGWPVVFASDNVRLLGYEPEDFTSGNVPFAKIVYPDDLARVESEIARLTVEGAEEINQEYRILARSGEVRWVDDRTWIKRDSAGKVTHYQGIMIDITKRRQAEEALLASQKIQQATLESTADGILVVDEAGKLVLTNSSFAEMWRIPKALLATGEDDQLLAFVLGQLKDPQAFLSKVKDLYRSDEPSTDIIEFKDGRVFERISNPLPGESQTRGRVWSFRDITERKQTQDLAKAQRDLALALGSTAGLFEALQASLDLVVQATAGMDCGGIYLMSPQSALKIAVYQGLSQEFIRQVAYLPADSPETGLVTGGQPVYTCYEKIRQSPNPAAQEEGLRALAVIPIQGEEGVIACLNVGSHLLEEVPPAARLALEAFASQIGNAIVRKRGEDLAREQHRLILRLSATSDLQEATTACIESAMQISNMDCGGVYLLNDEGHLNLVASKGLSLDFLRNATLYDGDSPQDHFVMGGKPVYCRSLELKGPQGASLVKEGLRAVAVIPLCNETEVIGCINVGSHTLDFVPYSVRAVLESFGSLIASVIARIRAETCQRESERKYRLLAENLKDVVLTISKEGRVSYCSPAITEFGGYRAEEELGEHIGKYFANPEELSVAVELIKRSIGEQKTAALEFLYLPKSGEPIPVEVTGKPLVENGQVVALQCVMRDITERRRWEEEIKESFEKLQITVAETVKALAATAEKRDPYTAGHQQRVARLACAVAHKLGLPDYRIDGIRVAAMVHDIGKICTPIEILNKPGALSELEMSMIKAHPEVAYDILHSIPFPWPVAQVAVQHHERLDGSGYPNRLKGEDILLEAKIVAVADVVEAMITHRPFRPARTMGEAQAEISGNRGKLYDEAVVDACLGFFEDGRLTEILDDKA